MNRKQLSVFFGMLAVYALCAFLSYAVFMDEMTSLANLPVPASTIPQPVPGLANAGIVLVVYGLVAASGIHFWADVVFHVARGAIS